MIAYPPPRKRRNRPALTHVWYFPEFAPPTPSHLAEPFHARLCRGPVPGRPRQHRRPGAAAQAGSAAPARRSEERRVGKEAKSWWSAASKEKTVEKEGERYVGL